tara:strand:- start:244 stop:486 length:243 start_codon:yes stop_codon:yes gene_type:complete
MRFIEFISLLGPDGGFFFVLLVVPLTGGAAIALMILVYDHVIKKILNNDKLTESWFFQIFIYYLVGGIIWLWLTSSLSNH